MDAVTDELGRFVTAESFAITRHGYQRLLAWLQGPGEVIAVGVDGCSRGGEELATTWAPGRANVCKLTIPSNLGGCFG